MSLLKIPFILLFTYSYSTCISPPHPPPPEDEQAQSTKLDVPAHAFIRINISKFVQRELAVLEILALITSAYPSILPSLPGGPTAAHGLRLNIYSVIGVILMSIGTLVRLSTYRTLGKFFRFQISIQKNHKLITSGPYAFVRHPSYTGLVLAVAGWFFWTFAPGSYLMEWRILETIWGKAVVGWYAGWLMLGILSVTLGRMKMEDGMLKAKFGKEWDEWAQRVRYSIFPGVY